MAVSITQTANPAGVSATSNVATYSSVSIGTAASNRIIVVLVGTELASSTPSGCTIDYGGGDTAMNAGTLGNFGAVYARAYQLLVPTGTTATIKVTYSSTNPTSTQNHIAVYSVTGAGSITTGGNGSTDMDATSPLTTGSNTIPTDGGFIAIAAGATDTVAKTWTNATEDIDADAGAFRFTTATYTTAGTATRTCQGGTNGEDGAMSWINFGAQTSPTVVLNSPADAGSTSDTTPDLVFTGTDADSDDVRYEVQVDTSSNFDSQTGTEVTDQENTSGSTAIGFGDTGNGRDYAAQGFIPTKNTITAISFWVNSKSGTSTQGIKVWIDNADSNFYPTGSAGVGIGGQTEILNANITTGSLVKYTLSSTVSVTPGNRYVLCIAPWNTTTHAWSQYYADFTSSISNPYANGRRVHGDGAFTNWSAPDSGNADFQFRVYGYDKTPLLDKISGTDAGFSGTPDNSDPFTSGQAVTYTVQSGDTLSNSTTYYWRVRGIDPAGSNSYGSWATTRSFTTGSSGPTPSGEEFIMITS